MKKICLGLLTAVFLMVLVPQASGQFNRKSIKKNNKRIATYRGKKHFGREKVYSGIGFSVNAINYFGDLAPLPSKLSTDISFTKPGFGISFFHRFVPRYTLIGQFMYGVLKGSDSESAAAGSDFVSAPRHLRNLSFRNQIKELTVVAVLDLFENNGTYISRVKWTPYVFIGGSLFLQNPQAIAPDKYLDGTDDPYKGQWVDLQPLGTEGQYSNLQPTDANYGIKPYSLVQFAIPFGFGARFRLNEVFDLWADVGFRYTFTDYLDDVSKSYVDLGAIKAQDPSMTKLAQAMSYRTSELGVPTSLQTYVGRDGNTYKVQRGYGSEGLNNNRGSQSANDIFMVTSIKVTYILGATSIAPSSGKRPMLPKIGLACALFFLSCSSFSQISQKSEIGFGLGVFNYTGDLVRTYDLTQSHPAATVFYRSNISHVISLRTSLTAGQLAASDASNPIDPLAIKRNASFDVFLMELSGVFEYHFLDWRDAKRKLRFTPYLFAGAGLFSISGNKNKTAQYSNVQLAIPFGGGMKYVLNPKYYISFEIGIRKTFFDYLDNISGPINTTTKNYQYGNPNDFDNYFFTGISLTYTFYDIPCPSTNPYK